MPKSKIHILVDFDRTLVESGDHHEPNEVGKPIPEMVKFVQGLLDDGKIVKIFTARVSDSARPVDRAKAVEAINDFCMDQFGQLLEVTNEKDADTEVIYDDRSRQVIENKGIIVKSSESKEA